MTARGKPLALAAAENRLAELSAQWEKHCKLCRDCRPLTDTRNSYCAEGWEIVKVGQQAKNEIRQHQDQAEGEQLTLL